MLEDFGFMGNTNGNLTNGGYVADFGDAVLISMKHGLYILDKETQDWEKIYDREVKFLNISEGFIYFLEGKHTICEMSIMDSTIYAIVQRGRHNYEEIYYLGLLDEHIYYAGFWGESVYRLNIIEGEEQFLFHTIALNFALDPYYLYYSDDRDGLIRRLPLDEIDSILDMEPAAKTNMWLEYQGFSMDYGIDILKQGLDRKIEVNDLAMEELFGDDKSVFNMNFYEEWLYYAGQENDETRNWDDDRVCLYRISLEDFEEEVVSEDDIDYLNVDDGVIYYRNNSDQGFMYTISQDGLVKKCLTDFPVSYIHIVEDWVYCMNEEDDFEFYRINQFTHEVQKVIEHYGIDK